MKRRDFLIKSGLVVGGVALSQWDGIFSIPQAGAAGNAFSLHVMSGQPEQAASLLTAFINAENLATSPIKYAEYPLSGQQMGDIAFINNNRLVNFRQSREQIDRHLTEIARELELPRMVENPILTRFYTENASGKPKFVHLFVGETHMGQFPLHTNRVMTLDGLRGKVQVAIENGTVRIVQAACRHQTCRKMGAIHQGGQQLVCIPNQVRVALDGSPRAAVDGVAG